MQPQLVLVSTLYKKRQLLAAKSKGWLNSSSAQLVPFMISPQRKKAITHNNKKTESLLLTGVYYLPHLRSPHYNNKQTNKQITLFVSLRPISLYLQLPYVCRPTEGMLHESGTNGVGVCELGLIRRFVCIGSCVIRINLNLHYFLFQKETKLTLPQAILVPQIPIRMHPQLTFIGFLFF